jgi:hypothetical protein
MVAAVGQLKMILQVIDEMEVKGLFVLFGVIGQD